MGSNADKFTPIIQTPPNLEGQARVDLRKRDFDAVVWGKSYSVLIDKAIECPCRNKTDNQAKPDCRNCGGTGWVFLNRFETKAVIQSINIDTRYKEWSQEKLGMAKMTFLQKELVTFMDRVTITNATVLTTQVLHPRKYKSGEYICRASYSIISVEYCLLFVTINDRLRSLELGTDYVIDRNYIIFNEELSDLSTITIRYTHNPVYHIIDLPRATMVTPELSKEFGGIDVNSEMPLLANIRLAHYVIDENTRNNDWLLDNSIMPTCEAIKRIKIGGTLCNIPAYSESTKPQEPKDNIIIFNRTTNKFEGWDGSKWVDFGLNLVWEIERLTEQIVEMVEHKEHIKFENLDSLP